MMGERRGGGDEEGEDGRVGVGGSGWAGLVPGRNGAGGDGWGGGDGERDGRRGREGGAVVVAGTRRRVRRWVRRGGERMTGDGVREERGCEGGPMGRRRDRRWGARRSR